MDLRRLKALQDHFRRHPPVQAMVQAYLGIEPSEPALVEQTDEEIEAEFQQLQRCGLA